jgi:hypothetical protein
MIFQGPTFVYASSMHDILARLIFVRALPLNAGFLIFDGALLLDARVRNFDRGLQLKLAMRGEPNICAISKFQMWEGEEVLPRVWLVPEQSHRWGTS